MSSYYDAFGGTSTDGDDPYADELELERRDEEMVEDEPTYDWSDLNDREYEDVNIITGEVENER